MNDNDLQKLGSFIAKELIDLSKSTDTDWLNEDDQDQLVGELARCMTLQNIYLEREEFEKCAVMKLRIKSINDKLGFDGEAEQ